MNISAILLLVLLPIHTTLSICIPTRASPSLSFQPMVLQNRASYQGTQLNMNESESFVCVGTRSLTDTNDRFKFQDFFETTMSALSGIGQGTRLAFRQSWWCFPMLLFLVPFICFLNGSCAQMPSWWAMSNLKYLQSSKVGILICCGFLSSNIFYFLSGLYLLNVIKPIQWKRVHRSSQALAKIYSNDWDPILGWLVLCSGGMSLLYHSFQALGPLNVAESLCFIDHGLAISSFFCFFDKCGIPSLKTLAIGLSSLLLLVIHGDVYPIVHSIWHLLSACTTVSWASDGAKRRRKKFSSSLS